MNLLLKIIFLQLGVVAGANSHRHRVGEEVDVVISGAMWGQP